MDIFLAIYMLQTDNFLNGMPLRNGVDWRLQYDHTFSSGLGMGYSLFRISFFWMGCMVQKILFLKITLRLC